MCYVVTLNMYFQNKCLYAGIKLNIVCEYYTSPVQIDFTMTSIRMTSLTNLRDKPNLLLLLFFFQYTYIF